MARRRLRSSERRVSRPRFQAAPSDGPGVERPVDLKDLAQTSLAALSPCEAKTSKTIHFVGARQLLVVLNASIRADTRQSAASEPDQNRSCPLHPVCVPCRNSGGMGVRHEKRRCRRRNRMDIIFARLTE